MADDDNETKAGHAGSVGSPRSSPTDAPAPNTGGVASEWTASDARGPLNAAGEPYEPIHEKGPSPTSASHAPVSEGAEPKQGPAAAHEPVAEATPSEPGIEPAHRSLWPVAAGLVVGALIGAGSAYLVYGARSDTGADQQIAALSARIDELDKRPDAQAAITSLKGSVSDLGNKVTALQGNPASKTQIFDPAPLEQKIAGLQTGLEALRKSAGGDQGGAAKLSALEATVAGLQKDAAATKGNDSKIAAVEASVGALKTEQANLGGKVAAPSFAVAADSLVQQIDQGQPYSTQVDALAALGADPAKIAILRQGADKGVPSAKALAAQFEPLGEPIMTIEYKAPRNAGFMDRLKSGMASIVSVRAEDDTSGNDLPSRVGRIKADLAHDDVAGALTTWTALPADAKAKSEAWGALAKTAVEAMAAARDLQHQAIAALAAKKS